MTAVLVAGGAGNLGRPVILRLAKCDHSVHVSGLPDPGCAFAQAQANIELVPGDLRARAGLAQAFDIPPESATCPEEPSAFGWYGTARSQSLLKQQSCTFEDFIGLQALYLEPIGEG